MAYCWITQPSASFCRVPKCASAIASGIERRNSCCFPSLRAAGGMRNRAVELQSWTPFRAGGLTRVSNQHSFGADRRNSSRRLVCPCVQAKRKSVGDRGDASQEHEEDLDEDLRVGLNEISTEALKVMLSEDDNMVAALREKVEYIGEFLVQEEQLDAARFMIVVRGMLDHEVLPQKNDLKGAYKKAFDKIASVIEDSGWILKQAGADVGGVQMVDDELMPPVFNSQY